MTENAKPSKLPKTGNSIFTVMSQMAHKHQALNLAQGFPDFEVSPEIIDLVTFHMKKGRNQYVPSMGIPSLRQGITDMVKVTMDVAVDMENVTITSGATEGLYASITALVHPGDEVIMFDPSYDSYAPVIELQQGVPIRLKLSDEDFSIDWEVVRSAVTSRTKAIIINTPHNPTGMVMSDDDMKALEEIAIRHDLFVISDEVYGHIVFDEGQHLSVLQFPRLAARSIAVFSFGKTFHTTGWKVGYTIAPAYLTTEIRKIHQFVTFTVHSPTQFALADFIKNESNYMGLSTFFQKKRDLFMTGLGDSAFVGKPSQGTYFQLLSFENLGDDSDEQMAKKLIEINRLATIPVSVFYEDQYDAQYLRFCFAKLDSTIGEAVRILKEIKI